MGTPEADDPIEVSCAQSWPSLLQTQISRLPPRLDSNATFLPSGEYCWANSPLVDANILIGGPAFTCSRGNSHAPNTLSPAVSDGIGQTWRGARELVAKLSPLPVSITLSA